MPVSVPAFTAGGNIPVARFVKMSAANTVVVNAAATTPSIGISYEGGRIAPTPDYPATIYAAISGDMVKVYGPTEECMLAAASGGWTYGQSIVSDGTGQGTGVAPTTPGTLNYIGAIALDTRVSGELGRVMVWLGTCFV